LIERIFSWQDGIAERADVYRTLTDRAFDKIRHRIVTGRLTPSGAFTEAELAKTLEMSKTPVREALLRLQGDGLVQAIPRRGYIVSPLRMSEIRDVFAFRRLIEGETAALAAIHATQEHLDDMQALIQLDKSSSTTDPAYLSKIILVNNAFHETIALAANNRRLHRTTIQILREFERFYYLEAGHPEFHDPDFVGHESVLDVICAKNPAAAREIMGAHIESSRRVLVKAITEGPASKLTDFVRL